MKADIKSIKIIIATALITFSAACVKGPVQTPIKPIAAVNYINASPGSQPTSVVIASDKLNQTPISYGQFSTYTSIFSGQDSVIISNSTTNGILLKTSINFIAYNNYSLFLINTPAHPELFLLRDTLNKPSTNLSNSALRFLNLSPDAPSVDLIIKSGNSVVTNKSFKGYSSFAEIQGNQIYTFQAIKSGTQTVLATLSNVKFQAGVVYTVWLQGLVANTSSADQLTLSILADASFQ